MNHLQRHLFAAGSMLFGTGSVLALLVALNNGGGDFDKDAAQTAASFEVPPKSKPPKKAEKKTKPKKVKNRPAPPVPVLGAGMTGLNFGMDIWADGMGVNDSILGDTRNVVMTEDVVDEPPRPVASTAPSYPARARNRGITGYVVLTLLVGADGGIRDMSVLESSPPGIFEDAAKSAVGDWRFEPGRYEGEPVAVRVRQTIRFELT